MARKSNQAGDLEEAVSGVVEEIEAETAATQLESDRIVAEERSRLAPLVGATRASVSELEVRPERPASEARIEPWANEGDVRQLGWRND